MVLLLNCHLIAYIISGGMLIELQQLSQPWDKRVPSDWWGCTNSVTHSPLLESFKTVSDFCPSVLSPPWYSQILISRVLIIYSVGFLSRWHFFLLSTGLPGYSHWRVGQSHEEAMDLHLLFLSSRIFTSKW